jgi:anti-sigma-K factor RskA
MTDHHDQTTHTDDCGNDVAAYALGALDPHELETFRRHLASCVVCRDELTAFEQVVNTLPTSAPRHEAPAELRRRVLQAIENEPGPAATHRREASRPRRSWSLVPRPALAFGAAFAVALVAFVAVQLGSSSTTNARIIDAHVVGRGTAQLRLSGGHAELVVHHFAAPPAGRIYEVWLQRGNGAPAPTTALFSVTDNGSGNVDVPGSLHGVSLVMVTPEPAGGSKVPTHTPVISAHLT